MYKFLILIFSFVLFFSCSSDSSSSTVDPLLDQDNDGIIDTAEDLNTDGDLTNDDTDGDGTANYLDPDDDGDSVLTLNEDPDGDDNPLNDDTDSDGTPNYLDDDDDNDGTLTINEDYNCNNNPTDDDLDSDTIADYLDNDLGTTLIYIDDDNDGFGSFNLNELDIPSAAEAGFIGTVTYHLSLADATSATAPISSVSSFNNTSSYSQTIYARVENTGGTSSYVANCTLLVIDECL